MSLNVTSSGYPPAPKSLFDLTLHEYQGAVSWLEMSEAGSACMDELRDLVTKEVGPNIQSVAVLVNYAARAGKCDGSVALATTGLQFEDLLLHELGHTFSLNDEYGGIEGTADDPSGTYVPGGANVTTNLADPPWSSFGSYDPSLLQQVPAGTCDSSALQSFKPWPAVGRFEGAGGQHCGVYRSSATCRMRDHGQPFCQVCTYIIMSKLDKTLAELPER